MGEGIAGGGGELEEEQIKFPHNATRILTKTGDEEKYEKLASAFLE